LCFHDSRKSATRRLENFQVTSFSATMWQPHGCLTQMIALSDTANTQTPDVPLGSSKALQPIFRRQLVCYATLDAAGYNCNSVRLWQHLLQP